LFKGIFERKSWLPEKIFLGFERGFSRNPTGFYLGFQKLLKEVNFLGKKIRVV